MIIDHTSEYAMEYDNREPKIKPKLTDIGTRFDHLSELLDGWRDGVEKVKNTLKSYRNDGDILRLERLEAAVLLLENRLEILSQWDSKQFDLERELQRAGLNPNTPIPSKPKTEKPEEKP